VVQYVQLVNMVLEESCQLIKTSVKEMKAIRQRDSVTIVLDNEAARRQEQRSLEHLVDGSQSLLGCLFPLITELSKSLSLHPVRP
jgi:hypothetical protein